MRVPFARLVAEAELLYAPPLRAPRTQAKIRQACRELAAAGVAWCDELTPALIAIWAASHEGRSGPGNASVLRAIRSVVKAAIAAGYLARDPVAWRRSWFDERPAHRPRHHGRDEIARWLDLLDAEALVGAWREQRLRALGSLVAHTGLRRDEALFTRVEDLRLDERLLVVSSRRRLKTRASAALVPIAPRLAGVLSAWLPRVGSEWLVPTLSRERPWTGGSAGNRPLDRLAASGRRAGIEGLTFLSLRHSLATHSASWGLGPLALKALLRHANQVTQRHYIHGDAEDLREIGERIVYGRGGTSGVDGLGAASEAPLSRRNRPS